MLGVDDAYYNEGVTVCPDERLFSTHLDNSQHTSTMIPQFDLPVTPCALSRMLNGQVQVKTVFR